MFTKQIEFKKLLLCGLALISTATYASRNRPFYQATRALAMGDAFTAFSEGFESVYYNPAGVSRRSPPKLKYFDLEILASQGFFSYAKSSFSNLSNLSSLTAAVTSQPDTPLALGLGFSPQFLVRNFSIGLFTRAYTEATYLSSDATMDLYAYTDVAAYVHYGVTLFGGLIKLGLGAKAIDRAEVDKTFTAVEVAAGNLSFSNQWQEGTGFGFDAGMLLIAPFSGLPTLGIAVQDIGVTKINEQHLIWTGSSARAGAPANLPQKVNIAFSLNPKHARDVRSNFSLEYKNALATDWSTEERLHAGWELNIRDVLMIRAGVNQGRYWTAGLGVTIANIAFEGATYGENLLLGTGERRDDRKLVGRCVLQF